jgi:hypothetical protein
VLAEAVQPVSWVMTAAMLRGIRERATGEESSPR